MSLTHQRRGRIEPAASSRQSPLRRRAVAASIGMVLMASACTAAVHHRPGYASYPPMRRDPDQDLSTGEVVAIGVGAAALGYFIGAILREEDRDAAATDQAKPGPDHESPGLHAESAVARLRFSRRELKAGTSCLVDLQVHSKQDGKWHSVTTRPEAHIRLETPGSPVVRQDGTKNVFCVPLSASRHAGGGEVVLIGTFALPGSKPLSARANISVQLDH